MYLAAAGPRARNRRAWPRKPEREANWLLVPNLKTFQVTFTEFDVTKQWMREPGSELPIPLLYLQDCVVRTTVSERDRSEIPIELW